MTRRQRTNLSSSGPWEPVIGYSRAVRVGDRILVAGTTATNPEGGVMGIGDPYAQAAYIIRKIAAVLEALDADLANVVRTRVYVTDVAYWPQVAQAHLEAFRSILPVNSLLVVTALVAPALLVEIEAEAETGIGATMTSVTRLP